MPNKNSKQPNPVKVLEGLGLPDIYASYVKSAGDCVSDAAGSSERIHVQASDLGGIEAKNYQQVYDSLFEHPAVPVRQFVEAPEYLGNSVSDVHDSVIDELEVVFAEDSGITEWILGGSVGWGKTTSATIGLIYSLYKLSCIVDPAYFFGLLPGSKILLGIFNITLTRSATTYENIKVWTDASPYFQKFCPRQIRPGDPIRFPSKNLQVVQGSLQEHALGENLFGVMIDEANFFKTAKGRGMSSLDRIRVHEIYKTVKRREVTRFMRYGVVPGMNMLISSQEEARTSFLDERIEKAKSDPSIHVTTKALWETKDADQFTGETFQVVVGNERTPSQILEPEEIPPQGSEVIDVPIEYQILFEEDPDSAVRDIAGRATTRKGRFFSLPERLKLCVDSSREHPFTKETLQDSSIDRPDLAISDFMVEKLLFRISHSRRMLKVDPGVSRAVHCDIGLTGDAAGIVIAHLTPREQILYYDLILKIVPPISGEIDIQAILEFLKELRGMGMSFSSASYDQYQSRQSIQQLKKSGFRATTFSVCLADYEVLRQRIYGGAATCSYYHYGPFMKELLELEKGAKLGDKPDHPPGGSNDLVEGAAAVAGILLAETRQRPGADPMDYIQRARRLMPWIGSRGPGTRF